MEAYHSFLNELVNKQSGEFYESWRIKWITYFEARKKEVERDEIIDSFGDQVKWGFKDTRPWINRVSEGCRLCGEGEWSCLFITGKCNAHCFYCPSSQDSDDLPSSQQMTFTRPEQYARYLKEFQFKGCSFSGGEPLMEKERVMNFLRIIRREVHPVPYTWMYTNGILANRDFFKMMAEAGLNEIRFNIGAVGYSLDAIRMAKGVIPVITVEIPAVPESSYQLKKLLPVMIDLGVDHLNLHQLRLTRYNAPHMLRRNYTYLHGERPTVLESELAALEMIRYVKENNLDIGVNYCGFQYKNRFQKAGYRRKIARRAQRSHYITENGYAVRVYGTEKIMDPDQNLSMVQIREQHRRKELVEILPERFETGIRYFNTLIFYFTGSTLSPASSFTDTMNTVDDNLLPGEIFAYETAPASYPVIVSSGKKDPLLKMLNSDGSDIPEDPTLFRIWKCWFIESGLRPYF